MPIRVFEERLESYAQINALSRRSVRFRSSWGADLWAAAANRQLPQIEWLPDVLGASYDDCALAAVYQLQRVRLDYVQHPRTWARLWTALEPPCPS